MIPGSGRSPAEGHGNPLQCSCLGNPMDRGAFWAAIHGVAKSQTRTEGLTHTHTRSILSLLTQLPAPAISSYRNHSKGSYPCSPIALPPGWPWCFPEWPPPLNMSCPLLLGSVSIRIFSMAAAAAKSPQLCPTLCDPTDGSPPGSPVPGILQARTLEWVAISFSNASK